MENKISKDEDGNWSVYTEITINAPKEKVWQVLTDFKSLREWSNSLLEVHGDFEDGGEGYVIFTTGKKESKINHIFRVDPGISFGWSDKEMPGFKDNHTYKVVAYPDDLEKSLFTQTDSFSGTSAKFLGLGKLSAKMLLPLYEGFDIALKKRVESIKL